MFAQFLTKLKSNFLLRAIAFVLLIGCVFPAVFSKPVSAKVYNPMTPEQIVSDSSEFFAAGADAYIMWQYSGSLSGVYFGNDKYSWFRDKHPEVCAGLREASANGLVGVNMWDLGSYPGSVPETLNYLKNDCGVGIIRTFAKAGGVDGLKPILEHAKSIDMKVIVAIGDHANGGGGMPQGAGGDWYASGYQGEYLTFANQIIALSSQYQSIMYAVEFANEPHCGSDSSAVQAYKAWGDKMGKLVQGAGLPSAYGQFASHPLSSCDSPSLSPSAFEFTNNLPSISKTSGHYYTAEEKALNMMALEQSKSLGKTFYIGEAGWGDAKELEKSDYYLYPITGFYAYDDPDTMQSVIIEELTKQGYQAQCLMPNSNIEVSIPANGNAPTRVIQKISVGEILKASSEIGIDFKSSKIPGWRLNGDHELPVINSIETLFGFKNTTEDDPSVNLTTFDFAPIYRSLTLKQQCFQQTKILDTIRNMCDKLANPESCSLNKPIDKTTFDILELQRRTNNEINSFLSAAGGDRDKARVLACDSIIENNAHTSQFRRALANTPLYISNAYRLGFLVLSVTLEGPLDEVSDTQPFRFLRATKEIEPNAKPIHEVRVLAFKLPDIGTNKDLESDIYYKDPLDLLSDTSLTKDEQEARDINYRLLTTTQNKYSNPELEPVQCFYPQSEYCKLPGVQALVKFTNMFLRPQELVKPPLLSPSLFNDDGIINEQALNEAVTDLKFDECSLSDEDIPYQAVSRIFSSGEIFETADLEFVEGNLYKGMRDVGVSQTSPDKDGRRPFSFMSLAKIRRDDAPVPAFSDKVIEVKGYLILPQGYQIGHIEETMFNRFHTKKQVDQFQEALKENPRDPANPDNPFSKLVRYFGVEGVLDKFNSVPENNVRIYDTEDPPGCVLPGARQPVPKDGETEVVYLPTCKLYDFFLQVKKDPFDLTRIHGGLFGEVFLAAQKTLYTFQSDGWKYIDSCETIEHFILGTCSGYEETERRVQPREVGPEVPAVAQCAPGSARITSGEKAQHVDAENSPPGRTCRLFSSSSPNHFISGWRNPNELPRDQISQYCQKVYSYAACTYPNALIQNPVDPATGKWLEVGSTAGITACEFVAQKAYDAGVSPIFALAMWGEESGFSHYRDAFAMGVVSQPKLDLEAQTRVFLNTVTNQNYNNHPNAHPTNTSDANTNNINSYLNFLEQYSGEDRGSNLFCRNPNFPARMKDYHDHLISRLYKS
jgi:hypothetical protein